MAIAEACGLSYWSETDYVQEFQRKDSIALGAFESIDLLGFIVGHSLAAADGSFSTAEIYNIGVRPDQQRKGIGQLLMQNFITTALNRGSETIWLETRKRNQAAIDFYQKLGFASRGMRRGFYSSPTDDAVIMSFSPG